MQYWINLRNSKGGEKVKIQKTTNYNQFKKIKGNRPYAQRHLSNLIASIAEKNLLEYKPILVNEQMEIIDGQHRVAAAKKLGLPVYFIQMGFGDLRTVIASQVERTWGLSDFLESHILLGNKDYKILKDYLDKYHLSIGVSIHLLAGEKAGSASENKKIGKSSTMKLFKEGLFKVTNLSNAQYIAEKVQDIVPHTEGSTWKDRTFIDALVIVYTKVKPSAFLEAVIRSGIKIPKKAKLRDYLILFEDIYNFRKSASRAKFYE